MKPQKMDYTQCAFPKKQPIRLSGRAYTEFKKKLYMKHGGRCFKCNTWKPLTVDGRFNEYRCAHVSHIVPRSRGGEDTEKNCRIACFRCHRGDHDESTR